MQQRFNDRIKDLLGVTDEEWNAISPSIDRVRTLQRDVSSMGGMGRMMFGSGGPGGPGGPPGASPDNQNQTPSDVQQKLSDLVNLLQNKDAATDDVKAKVAALRDARTAAQADLAKAQDTLRSLLTVRQEAVLVAMGILN
jgi:hypothetical protein